MLLLRRLEFYTYIDFLYEITTENSSLVFIKPENLTKTELIEKFKDLSSSKSLKDLKDIKNEGGDKIRIKELFKSYYSRLSAFISKYKALITKITLFTIIIKYITKFKLLRFIWKIINYILISTFGIFLSDIYGLTEIIAQIEYHWMKYVNFIHESKIYSVLVKIFHVVIDENKSEVIENKSEIINDKVVENKFESKIINSEIPSSGNELKNEKIVHDKTSGENEKEKWWELNKYFLIGLSIISLGLIYIYWDSINELFKNIKPDPSSPDGSNTPVFLDHKEEYERYFKEIDTSQELYDLEVIRNKNKGKTIEYIEVEHEKWEDSPTTPKPSTSKLALRNIVMLPSSRK
jgi:hypothetical protein